MIPVGTVGEPVALDADDSWHVGQFDAKSFGRSKFCRLMGGASMTFGLKEELMANQETSLRFAVFRADGSPVKLEPYMGMLGHAVVRREDGQVFTHLHPMGTISMATQAIFRGAQGISTSGASEWPANEVSFPYAFPRAGNYRIWVQVRVDGGVVTGVFDLRVKSPA
jgi:hypothetical protein